MKKPISLFMIISLLSTSLVFSQGRLKGNDLEENDDLMAVKTGIITQVLSLSPEQAQLFWPIYNKFEDQLKKSRQDLNEIMGSADPQDIDQWDEEKVQSALQRLQEHKQKEHELISKMREELREVITPQQILKLHISEQRFKKRLINRMKNRGRRSGSR
ncbi:MAG: hypothetical protein O3B88_08765 [Bacteroidetes bacterium]|nr:hypothetical protein [Bacteroidota bacterium]